MKEKVEQKCFFFVCPSFYMSNLMILERDRQCIICRHISKRNHKKGQCKISTIFMHILQLWMASTIAYFFGNSLLRVERWFKFFLVCPEFTPKIAFEKKKISLVSYIFFCILYLNNSWEFSYRYHVMQWKYTNDQKLSKISKSKMYAV